MTDLKAKAHAAWQKAFRGYIPQPGTQLVCQATHRGVAGMGQLFTYEGEEGPYQLAAGGGWVFGVFHGQVWKAPL